MVNLIETLKSLRNQAAESGDMETAYRHERRLAILVGMPASFTAKRSECPEENGRECFGDCETEDYGGELSAPCVGCGGPHPYLYCGTDQDAEVSRG